MSKLTGKQTELMSVEDILNLGADDVELFSGFVVYPECAAVGILSAFDLPTAENNNYSVKIDIAQIVEFLNPEADGDFQLSEGANITQRYNTGTGVQAMFTAFQPAIAAAGKFGALVANGVGAHVSFRITQRKVKDKETKEVKIYNGLADVTLI